MRFVYKCDELRIKRSGFSGCEKAVLDLHYQRETRVKNG
jgi:hypothetical protein